MGLSSIPAVTKNQEKVPAISVSRTKDSEQRTHQVPGSPKGGSLEDQVQALKLRNKVLTDALKAIKETADMQAKTNFELVWFAKNRSRFPNHKDRKRIEKQYSTELEKLKTADGDYHHGLHTGCLAASRMFQKQAEIVSKINQFDEVSEEMIELAQNHAKQVAESRKVFPQVSVEL